MITSPCVITLREEPSQTNVIFTAETASSKIERSLYSDCIYCYLAGCNCGLTTAVKTQDTILYFSYRSYYF